MEIAFPIAQEFSKSFGGLKINYASDYETGADQICILFAAPGRGSGRSTVCVTETATIDFILSKRGKGKKKRIKFKSQSWVFDPEIKIREKMMVRFKMYNSFGFKSLAAMLLFFILSISISYRASAETTMHTNNWAVLVCNSRFW